MAAAEKSKPKAKMSLRVIKWWTTLLRITRIARRILRAKPSLRIILLSWRFQTAVEKVGCRVIGSQPVTVQKKIVNLVWENELLDFDALLAKAGGEINGLCEIDVAIIVAMDEEDRGLPGVHRSDGRRIVSKLVQIRRDVLAVPVVGGPIVHTVKINTSGEEIGIAPEA